MKRPGRAWWLRPGSRGDDVASLDRRGGDGRLLELSVDVHVVLVVLVFDALTPGQPILLVRDERVVGVALGVGVGLGVLRAADDRGLELVDLAEVAQLARHVVVQRVGGFRPRRSRPGVLGSPGLALLGSLSVTRHG